MKYRLGLDLGTNSIGWCVLKLDDNDDPSMTIKAGVCIFSDGRTAKEGVPLAVKRRNARSMRRNLDRRLNRKTTLLNFLREISLMPLNKEEAEKLKILNPYELRAKAINEKIPLFHLGRALMHLSKRRGFKSNRKIDGKSDESGKIKPAIEKMKQMLAEKNFATVGEYFYNELKNGNNVRTRLGKINGKDGYERYSERSMILDEFNKIITVQKKHHKELTEDKIERISNIIFFQRPLKDQIPGKCSLVPTDTRIPKAQVLAQEFIMLQKLTDLRVSIQDDYNMRKLSEKELTVLKNDMRKQASITFGNIRKTLKKGGMPFRYEEFSHEASEKSLPGNLTNAIMSKPEMFGEKWYEINPEKQTEIIDMLLSVKNADEDLINYLIKDYKLNKENAENVVLSGVGKLPVGYLRYGKTALSKIVPLMDKENIDLTSAIRKAGFISTTSLQTYDHLPYYAIPLESHVAFSTGNEDDNDEKRYGKITNPTVHIVLNQLRKLINELVDTYGKPYQIVLELARDLKNSAAQKEKIRKENLENRKNNDRYAEEIRNQGMTPSRDDFIKIRLWEEMKAENRQCVYSGRQISKAMLFTDEVQVEHILPFARTLDDSYNNKILSIRSANYYKGNRTPYEAFGKSNDGYNYDDILARVKAIIPEGKRWRFYEDAMGVKENDEDSFLDRQLNDTKYLSRIARQYLQLILDDDKKNNIWTTPGKLTSWLRSGMGLDSLISKNGQKNRNDHRHHAIDAFVIGVTTRKMIKMISTIAGQCDDPKIVEYFTKKRIPEPWKGFRKNIQTAIENIKVYHKPDHGLQGELHEATAYGEVKRPDLEGGNVVTRKPIQKITNFNAIRDLEIRNRILTFKGDKEAIDKFYKDNNIRGLRVLEKLVVKPINIKDKNGIPYKYFKGGNNICMEIFRKPDGKIDYEVVELFYVNQKNFRPKWMTEQPDAKLIARLFKGDIVRYKEKGKYVYRKITSIWNNSNLEMIGLNEAGDIDKRNKEEGKIVLNKSARPLFNDLKAESAIITITGVAKKAGYPNRNYWDKK